MNRSTRRTFQMTVAAAAVAVALPWAGMAHAQDNYPSRTVRMIVPYSAGGTTDTVARLVAQKLAVLWGQPVVVENKGGAGGNIGADLVAKATPDGYTILMGSGALTINPHVYKKLPFDTKKDLVPITNVAGGPMLVVVPDASPAKNLKDLIAMAKAKPGSLNFGSAGVGTQVHLAGENLADAAKLDIVHVPYKGEAPALADLMGNNVQLVVGNFAAASALVGKDRLRALAVTGKVRSPQMPEVPTVAESGLPGFVNTGWFGLFAPKGTSQAIVEKIQRDTVKVLGDTETKALLYSQGMQPIGNTSEQFRKDMDVEWDRWAKVVANRKITAN